MIDQKNWYESKTIWGAILAAGASLAGMAGLTMDASAQDEPAAALIQTIGGAGALMAIYGRLCATDVIG